MPTSRPTDAAGRRRRPLALATALCGVVALLPAAAQAAPALHATASPAATTSAATATDQDDAKRCKVSARLVPRCGAWFGVGPNPYGSESFDQALVDFEQRAGRTVDIAHYYTRGQESVFPGSGMLVRADEPGRERLLLINWRPTITWRAVADGAADAYLERVAAHIDDVHDRPFFLTLHAEMESDVNPAPGSGMTASDFRDFFRHTITVLRANGAEQVVPVVNYTGTPNWGVQPWFDDLWPGARFVDWIAQDPYAFGKPPVWRTDFTGLVNRVQDESGPWPGFYEWSRREHPRKPMMLAEWGVDETSEDPGYKAEFFSTTLEQLRDLPGIKALVYWDHLDAPVVGETRIGSSTDALREFKEMVADPVLRRAGEIYLDRPAMR